MKIFKIVISVVLSLLVIAGSVMGIAMLNLKIKTDNINNSYNYLYSDKDNFSKAGVYGIEVKKQSVSCGYAVIEMFANFAKSDITEEGLYEKYGKVVTSTGKGFESEMNKLFPQYKTTMYKYLRSSDLLEICYKSLKNGIPVPFEWASKDKDDNWTLHYSLLTELNFLEDYAVVLNPYGYKEKIKLAEFTERTSFEAYKNMPFSLKLGFAFGVFEKNTVFICEKI